jgi:hypothetical protein
MARNDRCCKEENIVGREFSGRLFSKVRFAEKNQIVEISPVAARKKLNLWWTWADRAESLKSNDDRVDREQPQGCVQINGCLTKTKSFGKLDNHVSDSDRTTEVNCSLRWDSQNGDTANCYDGEDDDYLEF